MPPDPVRRCFVTFLLWLENGPQVLATECLKRRRPLCAERLCSGFTGTNLLNWCAQVGRKLCRFVVPAPVRFCVRLCGLAHNDKV